MTEQLHSPVLSESEISEILSRDLAGRIQKGERVLVIIPDRTRTAPIPLLFRQLQRVLRDRVRALDFLIALGTHPPLSPDSISALIGVERDELSRLQNTRIFNHEWQSPETFVQLGVIPEEEIREIAEPFLEGLPHDAGLIRDLPVTINRLITEYDHLLICGPTFPHEVVGFSGGNKYFFPGISGPGVINYTHWLGAVISSYRIIGSKETPVRRVIDRAASFIERVKTCISLVVDGEEVAGLFVSSPEEAYSRAAELSSRLHVRRLEEPVERVLSVMPRMYDDIWTAAKGMYKLEPVVREGGEVIIYAPHIDEISYTHGRVIEEIGYHVCDYFLKQWDRFKIYPGGALAHSTHLRGIGSYDAETGREHPRIAVSLATRIPEARCRAVNLGYCDPDSITPEKWEDQGEGHLLVRKAGELLYRLA